MAESSRVTIETVTDVGDVPDQHFMSRGYSSGSIGSINLEYDLAVVLESRSGPKGAMFVLVGAIEALRDMYMEEEDGTMFLEGMESNESELDIAVWNSAKALHEDLERRREFMREK